MTGLYDYDKATKQECIDELDEIIAFLLNCECDLESLDALERKRFDN